MKVYLAKVRINRQGYTDAGRYFGVGAPLWEFWSLDDISHLGPRFVRAPNREAAKALAKERYPQGRFFR